MCYNHFGEMSMDKVYACIDLKSFYASVECCERGLDPLKTNLVVADISRTEKTICLAVTPSLKQYGLSGRSRLFEVVEKVRKLNLERKRKIQGPFQGTSYDDTELRNHENFQLGYIVAPPRMKLYIEYSTNIYGIYQKFISPDDMYVYSIDEVFFDLTHYLKLYACSAKELVTKMILQVYKETGITATAGVGTNLYLAKVAMDIVAKREEANEQGVRIAELDEMEYRKRLWSHQPLTDFWRIGSGISKKLEKYHLNTMGDIAFFSLFHENVLFRLFGVNAELLIDHAWGWESCTLADIKNYKPNHTSLSSSQVLKEPYNSFKTRLIVKEMMELLTLDMVSKHYLSNQIVLTIEYDSMNFSRESFPSCSVSQDYYGRSVPKHAHGTVHLDFPTSSFKIMKEAILKLYDKIINPDFLCRRVHICVCDLILEGSCEKSFEQLNFFTNSYLDEVKKQEVEKENKVQKTILEIKQKYGKNAIFKGMNLQEGATTIERNRQIGGHRE